MKVSPIYESYNIKSDFTIWSIYGGVSIILLYVSILKLDMALSNNFVLVFKYLLTQLQLYELLSFYRLLFIVNEPVKNLTNWDLCTTENHGDPHKWVAPEHAWGVPHDSE